MKTSGYFIVVTAHYSDDSFLDLETRECKDIAEVIGALERCKLEYKSALSKDTFKGESIIINIRVFELNKMFIPKLISSFGLENGAWGGWSLI